nr:MAG TPA: hypothetical protein [Caudoviricetes sp.]
MNISVHFWRLFRNLCVESWGSGRCIQYTNFLLSPYPISLCLFLYLLYAYLLD